MVYQKQLPQAFNNCKLVEKMKAYMIEFLKQLGLDTPLIVSGVAGGIASLKKMTKLSWFERFISVLAGGFSANYLTPFVADFMNLSANALLGIAFLVGYGGLATVEYWFNRLHTKKDKDEQNN